MKRKTIRTILAGASVAALSATPAAFAQICRSGPEHCTTDRSALRCAVMVELTDVKGECTVTRLDDLTDKEKFAEHQVQACVGDTVTWTFKSECASDVIVEIGNFRATEEIIARLIRENPKLRTTIRTDLLDTLPFEGLSNVLVRRDQPGLLTGLVKAKYAPRTYKYDIIYTGPGRRRVLLDPESEIYP